MCKRRQTQCAPIHFDTHDRWAQFAHWPADRLPILFTTKDTKSTKGAENKVLDASLEFRDLEVAGQTRLIPVNFLWFHNVCLWGWLKRSGSKAIGNGWMKHLCNRIRVQDYESVYGQCG